ncbi:MAG: response regulator [Kiritimatiellae bacterium]|nr:response regulator [Kiritimatiellia bacterium]
MGAGSGNGTGRGGKRRVLIMDDEQIIRDVVGVMLSHMGYEVEFAEEGGVALEMYRQAMEAGRRFDIVIMDLTIPEGMGGKEAIAKLLELDPGARALVSTGFANDDIVIDFRHYGFSGVVNKPFNMDGLCSAMERAMAG